MNKEFYSVVTDLVTKTLNDNKFELKNDDGFEYYTNGSNAFAIEYNEADKQIALKHAVLKEGEGVTFKTVSYWLLDENATERDMTSIGNDFSDTVLEQLGVKATAKGLNKVELPSKNKDAETVNIEAFTARFLSIFPAYKEDYKTNVSTYGEFMYDAFFKEVGPKVVCDVVKSGNKKQVAKCFDLLNSCYVIGDQAVNSTIVCCILANAVINDESIKKDMETYLEKYNHLNLAYFHVMRVLSKPANRKKYGF